MFTWDLRLQPGIHRFEKHLNCVLPDYKMGKAHKGKKLQGYINCQELGLELARNKGACLNKNLLGFKMVIQLQVGEGDTLKQCLQLAAACRYCENGWWCS